RSEGGEPAGWRRVREDVDVAVLDAVGGGGGPLEQPAARLGSGERDLVDPGGDVLDSGGAGGPVRGGQIERHPDRVDRCAVDADTGGDDDGVTDVVGGHVVTSIVASGRVRVTNRTLAAGSSGGMNVAVSAVMRRAVQVASRTVRPVREPEATQRRAWAVTSRVRVTPAASADATTGRT